jgi:hypothetical protein
VKVGFIVECGPQGAESKVIPHLARMIGATLEIVEPITLDSKRLLKENCDRWARALLELGCRRVLIIWDLLPAWGEYEGTGCRHDDKEAIFQSLRNAGLAPNDNRIRLVCIEKMLEAWLIADEKAISDLLSTEAHRIPIRRVKSPESISDPKAFLMTQFRKSGGRFRRYEDRIHAIQIAQRIQNLTRLQRLESFRRFEEKLMR